MEGKTEAELEAIIREARDELSRLQKDRFDESAKELVGKCLRFRNNYGLNCPGWWLYAKILEIGTGHDYLAFTFQECSDGRIEIATNKYFRRHDGWMEIDEDVFLEAHRQVVERVLNIPASQSQPR